MPDELDGQVWPQKEYYLKYSFIAADGKSYTGWAVQEDKSAREMIDKHREAAKKLHPSLTNFQIIEIKRI